MRILYVDIDGFFLNPTRTLVPLALAHACDVLYFGPGYSNSDGLRRGIDELIEAEGPFDAVVASPLILFGDIYRISADTLSKSYHFTFPRQDVTTLSALTTALEQLRVVRVAILLESDYYNWSHREIDALERRADYVIGFGPEFWRCKAELPDLGREAFAGQATDAWADWVGANAERIASLPHFVAETEFRWDRLAHRRHDWGMPGIQYHARRQARATLARNGLRPLGESPLRRVMGLLKKLKVMRREPRWLQHHLNADHQDRLGSVRFAYTCGSGLNMPVRKFFEIPAAGAVLVCQPFNGFAAAGFRDGENAVVCRPEKIMEAHRALASDLAWAQKIADAGSRLVFERHSLAARARQFADTLAAMADRSFAGGRWVDGRYTVIRRKA
jgi:hypothetical protein